jgi:hypothetical protein
MAVTLHLEFRKGGKTDMQWKKWFCFSVVFGSLLAGSGPADTWAGEKELIELLKKKNIITQEEADQLLEESKSMAVKEKAEMKKELKNEMEADLKKEGAKGEFLPPALKGFKFGTTIFAEWNAINRSGNNPDTNQFALNRGYVTLTYDFRDWLAMNFTSDLFTAKDANDVNNGLELRIKFAYVNLKLLRTETMFGMIPTPSDYYDSAIWPFRVQGNNLLDGLGIQATADLGAVNTGTFGGVLDEDYLRYAAKSFAGKWGGYMIGVYNGAGFDTTEDNNNKVVSGLAYFRPFPGISLLKGLQLAYVGTYGESNAHFAPGNGPTSAYPTWQANIGQVSYQHPFFTVMGQYYWGKGTRNSNEENDRQAYLVAAFLRIPGLEKLRPFGKWYYYDPNTDLSDNERNVYVAGLAYDVTKEFMPFIAWEHQDSGSQSGVVDYNKFQVGFQLKY